MSEETKRGRGRPKKGDTDITLYHKDGTVAERSERQKKFTNLIIKQCRYASAEALQEAVDKYFEIQLDEEGKPAKKLYTMAGLAYHLGFKSRMSLVGYSKKELYADIINRAVLKIEESYEVKLHSTNPTGAIFALKNLGWSDNNKSEVSIVVHPFIELMKQRAKLKK